MNEEKEYAEYLLKAAEKKPENLIKNQNNSGKWKSIQQRLVELYIEDCKKKPHCKNLSSTTSVLKKLVKADGLNTLIVNFYPGNEGYSLVLRGKEGYETETIRLPYEETDFLNFIDNGEIPPLLIDLIDTCEPPLFYSGCIILEIRDYRRSYEDDINIDYVLLRPSYHTLLCDVNSLTCDGHRWTQEDKFNLESQLLINTAEPLCLDPSPSVLYLTNRLNQEMGKLNSKALKRSIKRYSQTAINRKKKMSLCVAPKHLKLSDFIAGKRDKQKQSPFINLKLAKPCVDMWKREDPELQVPKEIEVDKYTKEMAPLSPIDMFSSHALVIIEEYTLENKRPNGKVYLTHLTIKQRKSDKLYVGELYTNRNHEQGNSTNGTCNFSLGSRESVDKYIKQFTEIFTEEGRLAVKITHQVPGQPPYINYTNACHSEMNNQNSSSKVLNHNSQSSTNNASVNGDVTSENSESTVLNSPPVNTPASSSGSSGGLLAVASSKASTQKSEDNSKSSPVNAVPKDHSIEQLNVDTTKSPNMPDNSNVTNQKSNSTHLNNYGGSVSVQNFGNLNMNNIQNIQTTAVASAGNNFSQGADSPDKNSTHVSLASSAIGSNNVLQLSLNGLQQYLLAANMKNSSTTSQTAAPLSVLQLPGQQSVILSSSNLPTSRPIAPAITTSVTSGGNKVSSGLNTDTLQQPVECIQLSSLGSLNQSDQKDKKSTQSSQLLQLASKSQLEERLKNASTTGYPQVLQLTPSQHQQLSAQLQTLQFQQQLKQQNQLSSSIQAPPATLNTKPKSKRRSNGSTPR